MNNWRDKLQSVRPKIAKREQKRQVITYIPKKHVVHYALSGVSEQLGSKKVVVLYRLACGTRPFSQIPSNSTTKKTLVTCQQCLKSI